MINPLENPEISRRELGQGVIKCAAVAAGASLLGASVVVPTKKAMADELIKPDETLVGDAYALFCADDGSLTFVRSKTPIVDGDIHDGKTVTNSYTGLETESYDYYNYTVPWKNNQADVTSVSFKDEIRPVSTACWFEDMKNCTNMDLVKLDTSRVTDMDYMFFRCSGLTSLDVSGFNTSSVMRMCGMFAGCRALTTLDLSGFDTSRVTYMNQMFDHCSELTSLDLSGFDTSRVVGMNFMFFGCKTLTSLDVSGFDTSSAISMHCMFSCCKALTSLDLSGFDTSKVKDMSQMFDHCSELTSLDVSGFDTSSVADMNWMFWGCLGLTSLDLSSFDTSSVTTINDMLLDCPELKIIKLGARFSFLGNATSEKAKYTLPGSTWKNAAGIEYAVDAIPNNVADTYTKVA